MVLRINYLSISCVIYIFFFFKSLRVEYPHMTRKKKKNTFVRTCDKKQPVLSSFYIYVIFLNLLKNSVLIINEVRQKINIDCNYIL